MLSKFEYPDDLDAEPEVLGIYWTPVQDAETDEVHPKLLQAVAERSVVTLYTAALYETDCGAPVGYIDLATDIRADEACAVYHPCFVGEEDLSSKALWFPMQSTIEDSMQLLVDGLQRQGWL